MTSMVKGRKEKRKKGKREDISTTTDYY